MSEREVIGPASPFQEKYLNSDAQMILVGGAAGSSKSYIGLMRHLRFINDPNYRAYCIRKNSSAIMASGGLFWEAVALYSKVDPKLKVKLKEQKLVFSSGAEISFSHYENDTAAKKYQGIQISNIFYDEVTHADSEEQIWWLWSRLRSNAKNVHSIWMSCNPDNSSWVLKYAMWYLYPQGHPLEGRPDPEKNGKIRYLLRINGELCWGDTKEELQEKYGYDKSPISFQGLFGTIEDNPPLQASNPQYKQNLEALPRLAKERLLYGNWFAKPESSSYFSRSTCPTIAKAPLDSEFDKIVRAFDVAGTLPHEGNRSPDYFASVKMGRLKSNGEYVVLEVTRTRITFGQWLDHILDHARRDGFKTEIVLGEDPNPAAKASIKLLARQIIEAGYIAKTQRASQGKLDAFRPFAASAELGIIHIVDNCGYDYWNKIEADNEFFLRELENFDGTRKSGEAGHDDIVDCMSLAYMNLVQKFQIPTIAFPSMSQTNPFRV